MKINRRDTLKTLVIGGFAVGSFQGCRTKSESTDPTIENTTPASYGRTEAEKIRDQKLMAEPDFFTSEEGAIIAILADIICPKDDISGSATDAEIPEFINFIVKDMPKHQLPLRSGIAWLQRESNHRYEKTFVQLSEKERLSIVDDIAYPDKTLPEHKAGEKFFNKMRDLTLTGFYTSKIGVKDLGYLGNRPNFWDGVPDEVMKKHGFKLDDKYKDQYITEESRIKVAAWNDQGDLI